MCMRFADQPIYLDMSRQVHGRESRRVRPRVKTIDLVTYLNSLDMSKRRRPRVQMATAVCLDSMLISLSRQGLASLDMHLRVQRGAAACLDMLMTKLMQFYICQYYYLQAHTIELYVHLITITKSCYNIMYHFDSVFINKIVSYFIDKI